MTIDSIVHSTTTNRSYTHVQCRMSKNDGHKANLLIFIGRRTKRGRRRHVGQKSTSLYKLNIVILLTTHHFPPLLQLNGKGRRVCLWTFNDERIRRIEEKMQENKSNKENGRKIPDFLYNCICESSFQGFSLSFILLPLSHRHLHEIHKEGIWNKGEIE